MIFLNQKKLDALLSMAFKTVSTLVTLEKGVVSSA